MNVSLLSILLLCTFVLASEEKNKEQVQRKLLKRENRRDISVVVESQMEHRQ